MSRTGLRACIVALIVALLGTVGCSPSQPGGAASPAAPTREDAYDYGY